MTTKRKPRSSQRSQRYSCSLRTLRALRFFPIVILLTVSPRAQAPVPAQPRSVFKSGTELVLVNVVVRDKNGAVVRGLTRDDFTIAEDDKPQTATSFDFEELDAPSPAGSEPAPAAHVSPVLTSPRADAAGSAKASAERSDAPKVDMKGRRLIVLFFDLSSMQPEEAQRAVKAAHDYVDQKLSPADLIAVASFSTALNVDQDFTADRALLAQAIDAYGGTGAQGFDAGTTGDAEDTPDNGAAFTPDDTEFNIFTTDRRLDALQSLADQLSGIEQKKSVIYFSSGMSQQGQDNQVQLRRRAIACRRPRTR
jgi:VWFA-related protein